jgi:DNA recombination protein RmuC
MEFVALGVGIVALVGVVLLIRRLDTLHSRVGAVATGEAAAMGESRAQIATLQQALQSQLAAVEQQVAAQVGQTHAAVSDVRERLGALQQQSREIADLARDVGTLQDLLRPPKLRGGVGELLLERILEDILPGRYERQFEFPSTRTRVDAVVRIGDKLVPIDAKFPLDVFVDAARATGEERRPKRRAFVAAVKRHIDQVAERYVVPQDGTIDFAFAYIPSEAVYYELTVAQADDDFDLRAYCAERRVLPVSPNTLQAFLAAVHLGLRGLAIQESAKEIQRYLGQIGQDLARLDAEHQKLGRHLDNARQVHDNASRWLGRVGERLRQASSTAVAELPAQPALPLDGED